MAIAGLLVHTLEEHVKDVRTRIGAMPGMTIYGIHEGGIHEGGYIVTVAEFPSESMEDEVEKLKDIEGVLTIYTTYVTVEDEMENAE
ncbi:MAG: chaperone NapD [Desulfobacterales bacterium]|nr:chaperone NapD [Desulfobacterales bacterium]